MSKNQQRTALGMVDMRLWIFVPHYQPPCSNHRLSARDRSLLCRPRSLPPLAYPRVAPGWERGTHLGSGKVVPPRSLHRSPSARRAAVRLALPCATRAPHQHWLTEPSRQAGSAGQTLGSRNALHLTSPIGVRSLGAPRASFLPFPARAPPLHSLTEPSRPAGSAGEIPRLPLDSLYYTT